MLASRIQGQEGARGMDRLTIAVVEDDPEFREAVLLPLLERSGFSVTGLGSALELYRSLLTRRYDLVLLDIGLPDECGIAIARHLRETLPDVGLVILSGNLAPEARMRGLQAGVDAYLCKPVEALELVATLRNLAQRVRAATDSAAAIAVLNGEVVQAEGGWWVDERGWRIRTPDGATLTLNQAERQVVALLAATSGAPVSREAMIEHLVEDVHDFDPHRLETLVYRLRQKCSRETGCELPLKTVRGVGYMLAW